MRFADGRGENVELSSHVGCDAPLTSEQTRTRVEAAPENGWTETWEEGGSLYREGNL